jgi:hypothetical protein
VFVAGTDYTFGLLKVLLITSKKKRLNQKMEAKRTI